MDVLAYTYTYRHSLLTPRCLHECCSRVAPLAPDWHNRLYWLPSSRAVPCLEWSTVCYLAPPQLGLGAGLLFSQLFVNRRTQRLWGGFTWSLGNRYTME